MAKRVIKRHLSVTMPFQTSKASEGLFSGMGVNLEPLV